MRSTSLQTHWGCVRISGTDAKISRPLIRTKYLALLVAFFRNPIVSSRILFSEFLLSLWGNGRRQRNGFWQCAYPFSLVLLWLDCFGLKKGREMLLESFSCFNH